MAKLCGTIRRSDLEGGVWQLEADDGTTYEIEGEDAARISELADMLAQLASERLN